MKTFQATIASDAEPAKVWAVMCDLENWATTISGITAFELLDDGTGFGIGTKWRETRTMFGKEVAEVMEVVAIDEGRSYRVFSAGRGADYTSTMEVEAKEGQSMVTMSLSGEPTGLFSKVMGATVGLLFAGATRRMIEQDLQDIVSAAEQR